MFRREVVGAYAVRWEGTVRVTHSARLNLLILACFLTGAALLFFAMSVPYNRLTSATGFLKPVDGVPEIASQSAGRLLAVYAHEGQRVDAGERLFSIDTDVTTTAGSKSHSLSRDLDLRIARVRNEQLLIKQLGQARTRDMQHQVAAIGMEIDTARRERVLAQQRIKLATDALARSEQLARNGFISEIQLQEKHEAMVDLQLKEQAAQRLVINLERSQRQAALSISEIERQTNLEVSQIEEQALKLEGEKHQSDQSTTTIVTAPFDGIVSAIAVEAGAAVQPGQMLANLLRIGIDGGTSGGRASCPKDAAMNFDKATECQKSGLRAVVFIPSQRIGFVKIGQRVRISYDAFPQHRFGKHSGTIRSLSLTPMAPALLPQGRKTGLYANMSAEEPLYRADIDLDAQVVSIDHEDRPLIPGMSLTVDLVLERRSIFEAIFEPILRLHRRMGY